MKKWFMRTMQQKDDFGEIFRAQATIASETAYELLGYLCSGSAVHQAQVVDLEHKGDELVSKAQKLIDRTYIPRYDKPDIQKLTNELDNITDELHGTLRLGDVYGLNREDDQRQFVQAQAFCNLVIDGVKNLVSVMDQMPDFDHDFLRECVVAVDSLERQADQLRDSALKELFAGLENYTIRMEGWRQVFTKLETATDHCSHAMDTILSMARKDGK